MNFDLNKKNLFSLKFIIFSDKETIDLTKLDPNKDPAKSKTCLEFLIIVLSKHLELDPK
jgi:hypothetical protein